MPIQTVYQYRGIRDVSPRTEIDDTGAALITVPPLRKAFIRKVMIYNKDTSDHVVLLGQMEGTTFTQLLPGIKVLAGQTVVLGEGELPEAYVASTTETVRSWYAKTAEAISANKVEIVIEVEYG